jgi:hypothetical protein
MDLTSCKLHRSAKKRGDNIFLRLYLRTVVDGGIRVALKSAAGGFPNSVQ